MLLELADRPLPPDTVVRVTYAGSALEIFRLSDPTAPHKVAFCRVADKSGAPLDASTAQPTGAAGAPGAAGAAGAAGASVEPDADEPTMEVPAIYCDLWTAGFTELNVSGTGFDTVKYELAPKAGVCNVDAPPFILDSPDAG